LQNLKPDALGDGQTALLYQKLHDFLGREGDLTVKSFLASLVEQDLVKARELALWDVGQLAQNEEQFSKELNETIRRIEKESTKKDMTRLTYKIREAEKAGDAQKAESLVQEFKNLQTRL